MEYTPYLLIAIPILAALLATLRSASSATLATALSFLQLLAAGAALYFVFVDKETLGKEESWLRLDPLGAFFLFCISLFSFVGILYERAHWQLLGGPDDTAPRLQRLLWLWAAATIIPVVYGVLALWGAFAFLLFCIAGALRGDKEAAHQFSLRGWLALSLAMIGVVLFFWASTRTGSTDDLFSYDTFISRASSLDDSLMLAGAAFSLVGFGFFAGLWPGQGLLLETYQRLSAPKGFFYSTAIWSASLYAALRVMSLCAKATSFDALHSMLMLFGGLTLIASLLSMTREEQIKPFFGQLMSYHTGSFFFLLGFATRFTAQTALLSFFFWALCRGLLWISLGSLATKQQASGLASLYTKHRGHRVLLGLSLAACIGVPPLGTFISQWMSAHAIALEHQQWYANEATGGLWGSLWMLALYWRLWLWLLCSAVALWVVLRVGLSALQARPADELPTPPPPKTLFYAFAALFLFVVLLGVFIPEFVDDLFDQTARQLIGEWSGN